jgi:hypothetical protein
VSFANSDDADITYALVCLKTGALLRTPADGPRPSVRLIDLAAAARELFRAGAHTDFGALFAPLGSEQSKGPFQEIVFMSAHKVHVAQRLLGRPDVALVALSSELHKLGLMLSGVRARLLELEAES